MCKCDNQQDDSAKTQSAVDELTPILNKYIEEVNQCETKAAEQFDKNLMTLSSGALGISLTFLSKHSYSSDINFLYISWFCFGATVTLSIFSYFVNVAGLNWQLEKTKQHYQLDSKTDYPEIDKNPFRQALYVMSWFAAVSFILGLIFTGLFIKGGL